MRYLLFLSSVFGAELFWKCFSSELDIGKTLDCQDMFPMISEKKDSCKAYIEYLKDGKALFENCLQKYIFSLNPCDLHLKPEQVQLILQTFRALQQFIVICCKEYDAAFEACDVEKMYKIAERQFSLLDGDFSLQHCLTKCKQEYERCTRKGAMLCDKEKNYILPGPVVPYACVIPSFCSNPVELMKCTPTIDIECFTFLLIQVRSAFKESYNCDWDALARLQALFNKCCLIQSHTAILRIKICILAIVTDLRTNSVDCSFKKYCAPLMHDNNHNFTCNIDPALVACFGFAPQ